jgi:hypothetical protein
LHWYGEKRLSQPWQAFKGYIGAILLGFVAVGFLVGLGVAFSLLVNLVNIPTQGIGPLPLLAIGGVLVLILMLTVVAIIFSILGLTNKEQAMGLPEGSIRAVIALSLIVLFAILSVFLYQGVSFSYIRAFRRAARSTPLRTCRMKSGYSLYGTIRRREI